MTTSEPSSSYAIQGALFSDGTFYGSDRAFQDFAHRISTLRSMARDVQYLADKPATLALHKTPRIMGGTVSVDVKALQHRANMATILLLMRDNQGDQSVEDAIARSPLCPMW